MREIQGAAKLAALPISEIVKIRDLEHFEGPLLSHFVHSRGGDHYLYYWCDCDDEFNRWMVLRVTEANIVRLASGFVPLDYVIPRSCQDDYVYLADVDTRGHARRAWLTPLSAIPDEYMPNRGAYVKVQQSGDDRSYVVLIEGDLSMNDLVELPTKYSQVYAMLFTLGELRPQAFETHPWRGGFSSMHFYRQLMERLPGEVRPGVSKLQYASPGFIRFRLHRPTAVAATACIMRFADPRSPVHAAYSSLWGYIAESRLNDLRDIETDANGPAWEEFKAELYRRTAELLLQIGIPDANAILGAAGSPFEAAKISLSFARRLRELAHFESDGLIRFPPR